MKSNFAICFFICLLSTIQTESLQTDNWNIAHYGDRTFENLDFCGYITLDGTKIHKKTHIDGYLQAHSAEFDQLSVKGHARIQESHIHRETKVEGELLAISVKFSEKLTCRCSKITLSRCKLDSLYIQKLDNGAEPVVELCDGTKISGSIIFESKHGKVIASKNSIPQNVKRGKVEVKDINDRF